MTNKLTTKEFIKRARKVHGNVYDYSKVDYKRSKIKVCIIDPKYGEFMQRPDGHLIGRGNPKRSLQDRILTTKIFIQKAQKIHNNLYDYSKVNYTGCFKEICIIDPEHGEFWQSPHNHLLGHGSPSRAKSIISIHKDHIIPISILGARGSIKKERPLYKFLNSDINIQKISGTKNISKGDKIQINGIEIRARHVRNNYEIIACLAKNLLDINIDDIIVEDQQFNYDENAAIR